MVESVLRLPRRVAFNYEGQTLKEKIARGALPFDEALDYTAQVAEGLAKAHAAGIVHRDIKPANVMVLEISFGS